MKKFLTTLALLSTANGWASTTPIEPVLIPITDQAKGINIQMGKYEVTIEEFTRFANATGHQVKEKCHLYNEKHTPAKKHGTWNNPDLTKSPYSPVVCIGADDAIAYASWLAESTGKAYRLAEYNEWEFAASGGKTSRFAFGDDLSLTEICDYENVDDFAHNAGLKKHHGYRHGFGVNCNDGSTYQSVVGMYRQNGFGLHDMLGNIREITKTCGITSKENPEECQHYVIAGGAWHWIPNPEHMKNNMRFIGSIEGFRVVLGSSEVNQVSKQTEQFIEGLAKAQKKSSIAHKRLKSLPSRVENVRASFVDGQQVNLSWSPSAGDKVTYTIYRSYLDISGQLSREMTIAAEGIETNNYLDKLPGSGPVSYEVFANNSIGESQPSKEVFVGDNPVFKVGSRIQAEHYSYHRKGVIFNDDNLQSVFVASSDGYYPPDIVPYNPASLTYKFDSSRSGNAILNMNIRGEKGALIEFWQGKNLVAQLKLEGSREFELKKVMATLKAGNEVIQIRGANKRYFILDWFELQYQ